MQNSFKIEDVAKDFEVRGLVDFVSGKIEMKANSNLRYDFPGDTPAGKGMVEIDFFAKSQDALVISLEPFHVVLGDQYGQCYISRTLSCNYLVRCEDFEILTDSKNSLRIAYEGGKISVELNGKTAAFQSEYSPTIDRLNIGVFSDCTIEKFESEFELVKTDFVIKPADDFQLQMTYDFGDDIIPAPCSRERLDELMKINSEMGFELIRWIDHGERDQGFWDKSNNLRCVDKHVLETFDSLEDHVKAGCESAHKNGMEFYTVLKPFDMSIMAQTFAAGSPEEKLGKEEIVGGKTGLALNYPSQNKKLCMKRRPEKFNFNKPETIVINSLCEIPSDSEFEIWVSDNNSTYTQYEKQFDVNIDNKAAVISGLDISSKFFAVAVKKQNDESIFNETHHLITVYDKAGKRVDTTLSFQPREFFDLAKRINHLAAAEKIGGNFKQYGFFFDYLNMGMPTGVFPGVTSKNKCVALDNSYAAIGVAIDVNDNIPGVMCPSETDAKKFWFEMIQHALDCGADGVDIRVSAHINILEYDKYGFNDAIVDEYKTRYGVDITQEDYDSKLLREIRGEFYTQFLKEAAELVHSQSKKICIHISDMFEGTPDSSMMMEIFWDWQKWLDEVKPDEVTFKSFRPDGFKSHFGKMLISMCQQREIKINYCPFVHSMIPACGIETLDKLADYGMNSFDFYENATMFRLQKDGSISCIMPEAKEYFERIKNG